ncbi:MAG TPA: PAS domain-containing protein, partial [Verrucomicrobiae bacterium]
ALLFVDVKNRSARFWSEFSVVLVGFGSLLAVLAYAYDIQSFYGFNAFEPMALHTAITFSVLAVAFLLSHTDCGLLAILAGDNMGGTLARRLLPAAVLVPAVFGWLSLQGEKAGIFHGQFSHALFAVGNILVFTFLVCLSAKELFSADRVRKNAEVALQESEARTRLLVKSSNIGLWDWNLVTNEVFFSPEWKNQLGYADAELPSRVEEWESRLHPEDREPTLAAVKDYVEGRRENYEVEFRLRHKEGSWRWILTRAGLTRDAIGQPVRIRGCHIDITGRKRAEAELERAHQELVKSSRQAGMAEVATGILHNVGNVLNSVNIASSCVADSLKKSKAANLSKVAAMLREHESDLGSFLTTDAKGKQLPGYLGQLAEHLVLEQTGALKELSELQKNIGHIKDIVTMQQGLAKGSGLKEKLQVRDLVEDALRMNASTLARHDIQIITEFKDVPSVIVEKHKVLQILVNLIRNARYACEESGREDKQMTMCVANGEGRIKVSVSDNGIGIPPENLARIFNHGFTTRKDGHGFGLHSGALAAKEMGGSLTVQSDGISRGATFTLELPRTTNENAHE